LTVHSIQSIQFHTLTIQHYACTQKRTNITALVLFQNNAHQTFYLHIYIQQHGLSLTNSTVKNIALTLLHFFAHKNIGTVFKAAQF